MEVHFIGSFTIRVLQEDTMGHVISDGKFVG